MMQHSLEYPEICPTGDLLPSALGNLADFWDSVVLRGILSNANNDTKYDKECYLHCEEK
jgi:hypothetical protein